MNSRIVPGADLSLEHLPTEAGERHEALVDLFGRYIMWMRNWNNGSTKQFVEHPDKREKLGAIFRRPFEDVSQLTTLDRQRALCLAEASVDGFIKRLLQVLAHRGSDFLFGDNYAIRFKVVMELVDKESDQIIHEEALNCNGQKHFADYWGKWLNRFRDEKTPESK